jgi:multicomponent Na+:H+ antiporter subunit E
MGANGRTIALSVAARGLLFLALWLVLAGAKAADLPAAVAAVAAALWASLRLMPPGGMRVSSVGIVRLVARFPLDATVAGIDVASRALAPHLTLRPGFVTCPSRQPPGPSREAFLMFESLLPGTVPCDASNDQELLVHCVDVTQPIGAQMARDESRFMRALRSATRNG